MVFFNSFSPLPGCNRHHQDNEKKPSHLEPTGILAGVEGGPISKGSLVKSLKTSSNHMGVSVNGGTPKSSIFIGFSIMNHPFWGAPIFGNIHIDDD